MTFVSKLMPNRKLTVKRRSNFPSYDANGFQEAETFTERTIKGNLQPISGHERLQLPEGERNRAIYWLYTQDTVIRQNDIVIDSTITGENTEYEVQLVEDWLQQKLAHIRARCVRRDV